MNSISRLINLKFIFLNFFLELNRDMGRRKLYQTEEEKKQAQREHGLRYYYRRKALKNAQQINADGGVVTVTVNEYSKKLGKIDESVAFKTTPNGKFLKTRNPANNIL